MKSAFSRFSEFFRKEQARLAVFSAVILVGVLSFEAGFLAGGAGVALPLTIEKPSVSTPVQSVVGRAEGVSVGVSKSESPSVSAPEGNTKKCMFVGSRNSNLYHIPTCAPAKRIKPENIVCFLSVEDAVAKGYKPGCLK